MGVKSFSLHVDNNTICHCNSNVWRDSTADVLSARDKDEKENQTEFKTSIRMSEVCVPV